MKVPFNDLYRQYSSLKEEIDNTIKDVIANSAFVRGKNVEQFEASFSELMGVEHCISCANGTDALYVAMKALGAGPGDEVIVPAHSWISTSETVTQTGATVVFCDTDPNTFTINPDLIEQKISPKTVGIVPVHLFGQAADMTRIMSLAKANSLWVVEDCAQAHLAEHSGKKVGSFGDIATYSFYPGKNLGAMGDAGAITTNRADLADYCAKYSRHGGLVKGSHDIEGVNSRMDGLQAAILNVKLPNLPVWTELRQAVATEYMRLLANCSDITLPTVKSENSHVWHLFVIQTDQRDQLRSHLSEKGIATVINYPTALPFLKAYERFGHKETDFPVAHAHQSRILSLPVFPEMRSEEWEYVSREIFSYFEV